MSDFHSVTSRLPCAQIEHLKKLFPYSSLSRAIMACVEYYLSVFGGDSK